MKKKTMLFLALALLMAVTVFAESAQPQAATLEGTITEIREGGTLLLETQAHGAVEVLVPETAALETSRDLACGDYVFVSFDGKMTRSLPAQVTAQAVRMYMLEGEIIESLPEENSVLVSTASHGEVLVRLDESFFAAEDAPQYITVYFDGAMTLSLPAQVSAKHVLPGYTLRGAVTQLNADYLLLGEGAETIRVNFSEGMLPQCLSIGDVVSVRYNGQMTRSLPAQISAQEIVLLSR